MMDNDYFTMKAKSWNTNPGKLNEVLKFMSTVRSRINLNKNMRVLDFGCGTGLDGINIINDVKTVAFLDPSEGMREQTLKALKEIESENYEMYTEITDKAFMDAEPFDFVMSTMAFHHIVDTKGSIEGFAKKLKEGGQCIIVDLCEEDGSFHGSMKVPHNGFNTEKLVEMFKEAGFKKVTCEAYGPFDNNGTLYPQFLIYAEM